MVNQKKLVVAALALLSFPALSMAQEDKKGKEKEAQTIIITRTGDISEKTVVEIVGDKVLINGKDAKDAKNTNVNVNVHSLQGTRVISSAAPNAWSFSMDGDHISLWEEDENRAMLGVVTESHEKGAKVKSITEGSGAEKMGIRQGDIITGISGKKIQKTGDVTEAIRSKKPGEKVEVTVLRDGKEQKISGELGKWKGIKMSSVSVPKMDWSHLDAIGENFGHATGIGPARPKLGISIQDTEDGKGVKIIEVEDDTNAEKAGLKEDDIILSVDGEEINSTDEITRLLRPKKDKFTYNFKINRKGSTQDVQVNMPRRIKTTDL